MKNQVKICLKTAWLVAAVAMLFMGTPMCVANGQACLQAGNMMLTAMFLITFPTGVLFFLITTIFVDPGGISEPSDFVTAWFIMMCGGLLQWFLVVPSLFEGPGLTTLNLEKPATLTPVGSQDAQLPLPEVIQATPIARTTVTKMPAPAPSKPVQLVSQRIRTRRKSIKSITAFDRSGRTPLERVIDHL